MFDYISILAGGRCSFNCDFCVGKNIRENEQPHFAKNWKDFIDYFSEYTELISISGSTSDPMLVNHKLLERIIKYSKNKGLDISLHTRSIGYMVKRYSDLVDELVISIDRPTNKNIQFFESLTNKSKVRISAVCTSENRHLFENSGFFRDFPIKRFTIRMNVFEPDLKYPHIPYSQINKNDYGALWYGDNEKYIALWDFRKTNKRIKAIYLWPTGEVNEQCHWLSLYQKS